MVSNVSIWTNCTLCPKKRSFLGPRSRHHDTLEEYCHVFTMESATGLAYSRLDAGQGFLSNFGFHREIRSRKRSTGRWGGVRFILCGRRKMGWHFDCYTTATEHVHAYIHTCSYLRCVCTIIVGAPAVPNGRLKINGKKTVSNVCDCVTE